MPSADKDWISALADVAEQIPPEILVDPDNKDLVVAMCRWFESQNIRPDQIQTACAVVIGLLIDQAACRSRDDNVRELQIHILTQLLALFGNLSKAATDAVRPH